MDGGRIAPGRHVDLAQAVVRHLQRRLEADGRLELRFSHIELFEPQAVLAEAQVAHRVEMFTRGLREDAEQRRGT